MRIQLICAALLSFVFSTSLMASSDEKEIQTLFLNYNKVMESHKVELVPDVFSEKFIKSEGGKVAFSKSVKSLPVKKSQPVVAPTLKIKQGSQSSNIFFVKVKDSHSDFVIVRENGKLKIDGTISDGE